MRLGNQRSVTNSDYAQRRVIDQSARCRLPPGPVDFMAVNNSNRRDRLGAYWLQFNTLWNKRTGYENRPLFDFLLTLRNLVARGLGNDRSSKHAGHDENCSAGSCQRLHELTYSREGAARKSIAQKQERQWLLPLPLRGTQPKFHGQNFFVRRP